MGAKDLKSTVWQMLPCILSNSLAIIAACAGDEACFRNLFLMTILHRAIRKNPATRDATDEGVQIQISRYLKGDSDCVGSAQGRGIHCSEGQHQVSDHPVSKPAPFPKPQDYSNN
ncbi:uncharacterized protein ACWYII_048292 [Salvelinus alpinus]